MEVQRINKPSVSTINVKDAAPKDSSSFNTIMGNKYADHTIKSLNEKMQEIEGLGNKLAESQTVENLRKYKKMVKGFMDDVVKNGLQLKEQHGFSQYGSPKIYKLVKQVDKKLVDLTDAVLNKEQKGIDLLGMVGEIKGMLINLYT